MPAAAARSATEPISDTGQRMCPGSDAIGSGSRRRASTKTGRIRLAADRRVS